MLRKIRIISASFCFVLITLLFLDFTGTLHRWFGWLAQIQLVPAVLAFNLTVIIALLVLTFLFGRVYCSVICPLGVMQDIVSWFSGKRKKRRFTYSRAISWLRYLVLAVFIAAIAAGVVSIVALFDPYGSYGRIASNLLNPIYLSINNLLAYFAERLDSYAFYSVDIWVKSAATLGVAALTFVVIAVLAWRNGRTYCNTICPVGTVLGLVSRISLFKPVLDAEKCTACGVCSKNCKASCIDYKNKKIDYSRCVTCMDCMEKCKFGALEYKFAPITSKKESVVTTTTESKDKTSRRTFLSVSALFAVSQMTKAQTKIVDGGLATIEDKKVPRRDTPILPAGSLDARNFHNRCTACQLCVSVCPNQILRPSDDLSTFMQPTMSYERGWCRPECTKCSEVCPSKAIRTINKEEKSSIQIGHAVWIKENCLPYSNDEKCLSCSQHCPTGAIQTIAKDPDNRRSLHIPVIDTSLCIGCGACENLCPSRPFSAIYVEGHIKHQII